MATWICPSCELTEMRADEKFCWGCNKPRPAKPALFTRERMKLAGTGFVQVVFVAGNTVFIAHYQLAANAVTALLISLIWTYNVKRAAFGDNLDRWFYAIGAALGSVVGNILATALVG